MDPVRRQAYLAALGIPSFVARDGGAPVAEAPDAGSQQTSPPPMEGSPPTRGGGQGQGEEPPAQVTAPPPAISPDDLSSLDWEALRQRVSQCRACELHASRTQTVFGVGNPDAELMIIGEAPGADEDRLGEPFVGRAGQLLGTMLRAIGLSREQVYIANILKCRPPGNRNPHVDEALACRGFLQRQIELVAPKLILSVGGVSAHNLLQSDESVGRLRKRVHRLGEAGIPLLVTYHPAYLLRSPAEKAKAWEDLQQVARLLR